jgi:uncharacterized protein YaaQ
MTRQECRARRETIPAQNLPALNEAAGAGHPLEVRVGGATVFVLEVGRFEQF